jgi:coenzyme F420-reducing hydrogenase gamma subunit
MSKSTQLGVPYAFPEGKASDEEHVNKLKKIIEKKGINVSVGQ